MTAGSSPGQNETIRWSLITVTYNSADVLARHWDVVTHPGVEWIVVDNNSSDTSAETARGLSAQVIQLEKNEGFGAANNVGFAHARGEFVAFVNPDVSVDWASLETLERALRHEDGIVAPQLLYPDGSLQPGGRSAPSLGNKVLSRIGSVSARRRYYIHASPGEEVYVSWVMGAAVVGRRNSLARLGSGGPWDESFFVYYEDCDLGLRAAQNGLSVRVVGDARWTHGWARETIRLRIRPWVLELRSLRTFYARYPRLIFGGWRGGAHAGGAIPVKQGAPVAESVPTPQKESRR